MGKKIYVPMPEAEFYRRTVRRDAIVEQFGEATVQRAETAAVMNVLIASGMVAAHEFVEIVVQQCRRIDQERRAAARLDEDRG